MKKDFKIPFRGLALGKHLYDFEINNSFFEEFDFFEIQKGNVQLQLELDKSERMLILNFTFYGFVGATCDRCGEDFDLPIEGTQQVFVKFGHGYEAAADDVIILPENEYEVDINQMVYEMIGLAIPIRKVHSENENKSQCNTATIKLIEELQPKENNNPSWNKLLNIDFEN
ncbi:MAG: DUF177 domain-containing protein [Bacteroidota bacterium]